MIAPAIVNRAVRVWRREAMVWRHLYRTSLILNFGYPLLSLLAFGFLLGPYVQLGGSRTYVEFVAPGLIALTVVNSVSFDAMFGTWTNLHDRGLYEGMVTAPISPAEVVLGEFLWQTTRALLYGGTFTLVLLVAGLVRSPWALLLAPVLVASAPLFAAPAMAWAILQPRFANLFYYTELVVIPLTMLSGVFFPLDRLPTGARTAIHVSPLYHSAELSRALVSGHLNGALWGDAAYLVVVALLLAPLPMILMTRKLTA